MMENDDHKEENQRPCQRYSPYVGDQKWADEGGKTFRSRHTEASLTTILRFARAKKHL